MNDKATHEEIAELRKEIEHFQQEKERVRGIVGQIGGMPKLSTKLINAVFIFFIILCFIVSLVSEGKMSMIMIDLGIAALAVKLIVLLHYQSKVNHFQLWVLSSIEWRLNEFIKGEREKK